MDKKKDNVYLRIEGSQYNNCEHIRPCCHSERMCFRLAIAFMVVVYSVNALILEMLRDIEKLSRARLLLSEKRNFFFASGDFSAASTAATAEPACSLVIFGVV